MYDYQENFFRLTIEREQAVYEKLLGQYRQLLWASDEGVYEVTVRSQQGPVVIAVSLGDGQQLTNDLIELFSKRIDRVEKLLNITLAEMGTEADTLMKREQAAEEKREVDQKTNWQAYQSQQQQLARMATETATPPQKRAGRPRKMATPQPEVVAAAGMMAAQVPMNGSTAQAVARATGQQPQG